MGTFSNQPCAADKCQEKAKKSEIEKPDFAMTAIGALVGLRLLAHESRDLSIVETKIIVVTSRAN